MEPYEYCCLDHDSASIMATYSPQHRVELSEASALRRRCFVGSMMLHHPFAIATAAAAADTGELGVQQ